MMLCERPCEQTGKGCAWVWEEWEDANGELCSDLYCFDCFRYRDWDLDEWNKTPETIDSRAEDAPGDVLGNLGNQPPPGRIDAP